MIHVKVMVFNATFNYISAISWLSVLLVEEAGVTGENHRPVTNHRQTIYDMPKSVYIRKLTL
jgi:hypothetical protein